ncbi:protein ANTAGONIST OF LIKE HETEROCHROMATIN PROTEIN 1-like [Aphis craccivora]|uniref:Protein ANTAGONIST OF LIKE HETEROCHROMATIN PROTEIN 1-like n=1 Tax=Aphis craccivora TaxID=307492 RepID=A0A6G0YRK0_APHCR|nr:protein ANTAGONIST OF LIKE HETEROCHROMATIN PROTEIN 1-like [Aphis craccivora]
MELNHYRLVQVLCVAKALGVETSVRFLKFYNDISLIRLYPEKFFIYYSVSIKSFDELLLKSYTRYNLAESFECRGTINHNTQVFIYLLHININ